MKHRAIFVVFAFAAVAGSLSACSSEHPGSETLVPLSEVDAFEKQTYSHDSDTDTSEIDPTLTVQSAKERARAVENELVAFVPAEVVSEVVQEDTGVILHCDAGPYTYMWSGHTRINTTAGVDWDRIVEAVAASAPAKQAMKVERDRHDSGLPRVILYAPRGEGYVFSVHKPDQLSIASQSPCFKGSPELGAAGQY